MDFQFTGPVQIRDSAPFITNHTLALIKVWFVCAHMCLFSAYICIKNPTYLFIEGGIILLVGAVSLSEWRHIEVLRPYCIR